CSQFFVEQSVQRLLPLRNWWILDQIVEGRFQAGIAKVFHGQVSCSRVEIGGQRSPYGIKILSLLNQAEETIVRNIFRHFERSQKPIQEPKDRIAMPLIQE